MFPDLKPPCSSYLMRSCRSQTSRLLPLRASGCDAQGPGLLAFDSCALLLLLRCSVGRSRDPRESRRQTRRLHGTPFHCAASARLLDIHSPSCPGLVVMKSGSRARMRIPICLMGHGSPVPRTQYAVWLAWCTLYRYNPLGASCPRSNSIFPSHRNRSRRILTATTARDVRVYIERRECHYRSSRHSDPSRDRTLHFLFHLFHGTGQHHHSAGHVSEWSATSAVSASLSR